MADNRSYTKAKAIREIPLLLGTLDVDNYPNRPLLCNSNQGSHLDDDVKKFKKFKFLNFSFFGKVAMQEGRKLCSKIYNFC
jgi:hypothetical protein